MKQFLVLVPIVSLVLLYACGNNNNSVDYGGEIPQNVVFAVVQTQTATAWTPTPLPATPNSQTIMYYLNLKPMDEFDNLEDTIDAGYKFLYAEFPPDKNGAMSVFQVNVRCQCARKDGQCCSRERGFVYTMVKMKPYIEYIVPLVPPTVSYLNVVTYDHTNPLPAVSAEWDDVKNFLRGWIDGASFGFQVTPAPAAP